MKTNEKRKKFDTVQTTKYIYIYMYINKKAERLETEKEENEVGLK